MLAVVGGVWLLVGPSIYPLWGTELAPFGSTQMRTLKWIGYFYGTGTLITSLAVFAEGMLSRTSYVEERSGYLPLVSPPPAADAPVRDEGESETPVS